MNQTTCNDNPKAMQPMPSECTYTCPPPPHFTIKDGNCYLGNDHVGFVTEVMKTGTKVMLHAGGGGWFPDFIPNN